MKETAFINPHFFWLFLLIPILIFWFWYWQKKEMASLTFSSTKGFQARSSWKVKIRPILFIFRLLSISFLIIALARPQSSSETTKNKSTEGIDIVLAIDISSSSFTIHSG